MRNFDATIAAELAKENFTFFFMLELQLSSTLRITDFDVPVYDEDDNLFTPVGFKFDNITGSAALAVESLDIEIDDTNQAISAAVLGEDVRNKWAILYIGVYADQIVTQEFMRGIIGGWELFDDNKAKITITNEMVLWKKRPLRIQMSSCPWVFKGEECGYTGSESTCDQSYDDCNGIKGNAANFGGDRFLPALMEKEIWWGRTRDYVKG